MTFNSFFVIVLNSYVTLIQISLQYRKKHFNFIRSRSFRKDSSDSIFDILINNNISNLTLVEDSPTGFLQARKVCFNNDIDLIFGLRLSLSCSIGDKDSIHKIIVFAKNDSGCKN